MNVPPDWKWCGYDTWTRGPLEVMKESGGYRFRMMRAMPDYDVLGSTLHATLAAAQREADDFWADCG